MEDEQLQRELEKVVKRANQRILALERLTKQKGTFATKQLYDYLDNSKIKGITKSGRISSAARLTTQQKVAILKASKDFLESDSTVKQVRNFKQKAMKELNRTDISFKYLNTLYNTGRNWKYYQEKYELPSNFWQEAESIANLEKDQAIDRIAEYINTEVDRKVEQDLTALYLYIKG